MDESSTDQAPGSSSAPVPSLEPLEGMVLFEIESQRSQGESLDAKAGIAPGIAGAFVALPANALTGSSDVSRVIGIIAIFNGGLFGIVEPLVPSA